MVIYLILCIQISLYSKIDMQVIILAGGFGTRLQHLTKTLPKPMIEIGKKPFLELLLIMLKNHNFFDIVLSVGFMHEKIIQHFSNGEKFGMKLRYFIEKKPLGTAGCFKKFYEELDDVFLVINGDTYLDFDYDEFLRFCKKDSGLMQVVSYVGPEFYENKYNMSVNNNLINNYSKNSSDNLNAIDAGIYCFKKKLFEKFDNEILSIENDIFPALLREKMISSFPTEKRFYDIGTISRLNKFKSMMND